MSEKESSGGPGSSPVVVVESARHQTFRPDLQETELRHKRSKAPGVPPVNEELKEATEHFENKERRERENDRATPMDKQKHSSSKKLLSTTKIRSSSPEVIALSQVEVELKGTVTPIPAQLSSTSNLASEKDDAVKKTDDDSITEETPEQQKPEDPKTSTDWEEIELNTAEVSVARAMEDITEPPAESSKKKEISWNDPEYLQKVNLQEVQTQSEMCVLARKASIGPCFPGSRLRAPSGITICIPKKSLKSNSDGIKSMQSVINISISKKCLVNENLRADKTATPVDDSARNTVMGFLRGKIRNMRTKLANALNE